MNMTHLSGIIEISADLSEPIDDSRTDELKKQLEEAFEAALESILEEFGTSAEEWRPINTDDLVLMRPGE